MARGTPEVLPIHPDARARELLAAILPSAKESSLPPSGVFDRSCMSTKVAQETTFRSSGVPVRLEAFFPEDGRPCAAVLLLHGASGINGGGRYIPQLASVLAEQGLATLLVRYFDATGTTYASDSVIWKQFD